MSDERKPYGGMTPDEIDSLVERTAERVVAKFYQEIGKSVWKKLTWLVGIVTVSLFIFLSGKDAIFK